MPGFLTHFVRWTLRKITGSGSTRAKDALGTPTQSHISLNIPDCTKIRCRDELGANTTAASEERRNNLTGVEDFYLKAKAIIWP